MATQTIAELTQTATTVLSTDLNSLANLALVVSTGGTSGVFNNTIAGGGTVVAAGFEYCDVQLHNAAPGGAFNANSSIDIWFLRSIDGGSTFEDGSSSITPTRPPDASLGLQADSSAHTTCKPDIKLPPGYFKVLAKNNASGQSLASSGNTVIIFPHTPQGQAT